MRRVFFPVLCALAACAPATPNDDAKSNASPLAGGIVPRDTTNTDEKGSFQIVRGDSTVATVRFVRTGGVLINEVMGGPDDARMAYTADLNRNGTVRRLQARLFARRDDPEPRQRVDLLIRGDSMDLTSTEGEETQRDTAGVAPGTLPIPVGEDVAMAEQILRRARTLRAPLVEVPIVTLEGGAKRGTATVTFVGKDSAHVRFRMMDADPDSTNDLVARTDAAGRLLGGRIPAQGVEIRREQ